MKKPTFNQIIIRYQKGSDEWIEETYDDINELSRKWDLSIPTIRRYCKLDLVYGYLPNHLIQNISFRMIMRDGSPLAIEKYTCDICHKEYPNYYRQRHEQSKKHRMNLNPTTSTELDSKEVMTYYCEHCHKTYSGSYIKKHLQSQKHKKAKIQLKLKHSLEKNTL
jgi:hypothetical protein